MNNTHLVVASINLLEFTERSIDENGIVKWKGICIELLDILSEMLHFSYSIIDSIDGRWGGITNGSWDGLVKMILDKQCDLAVSKITVTPQRRTVVDFSSPFWFENHVILTSINKPSYDFLFLKPFKKEVWYCLLSSILLMSIVLYLIRLKDPFGSMWYIYGSFLNQGNSLLTNNATKFFFSLWWIFVIIIYTLYSANLIAYLTIKKSIIPINSLEDLADSNVYYPVFRKSTAIYNLVMSSKIPDFVKLREKIAKYGEKSYYQSYRGAINRIGNNEHVVIIVEEGSVRSARQINCDIRPAKDGFLPATFGMLFPKNSPYKTHFDRAIERIVESGVMQRLKQKYVIKHNCQMTPFKMVESTSVSLPSFSSVIYLLFGGLITSSLSLLLEFKLSLRRLQKL